MAKRSVTSRNFKKVLQNLTAYALAIDDKSYLKHFCFDLNTFLDHIAEQDGFGTEGQLDPRGDQRD